MTNQINVKLVDSSYSINIGDKSLKKLIDKINSSRISKCLIVIDSNVNKHHSLLIRKTFALLECKVLQYIFIVTEKNKSLNQIEKIYNILSYNYFGRDSAIVAIGGGVTGDVAGFAASTYMRGIKYFQVPTTLLAMVDSSVGGKTGVNFNNKKNLIGSFYQPDGVFIYTDFLKTLPYKELISGAGEVFKYSFLAGHNNYLLLNNNLKKLFEGKEIDYNKVILSCLKIKSNIVAQDEKETTGLRKVLNLGHTFAHAFEVESNYKLKHGEAVIAGIYCALVLSEISGYLSKEKWELFFGNFSYIPISKTVLKFDQDRIIQFMFGDKKNTKGNISFVLIEEIGSIVVDVVVEKASILIAIKTLSEFVKDQKRFKRGKLSSFEGET